MSTKKSKPFSEADVLGKGFIKNANGSFSPIPKVHFENRKINGSDFRNEFRAKQENELWYPNLPKDHSANNSESWREKSEAENDKIFAKEQADLAAAQYTSFVGRLNKNTSFIITTKKEDWCNSAILGEKRLTICLMGIPMPKQSVRSFLKKKPTITKAGNENWIGQLQPEETRERKKDYQRQICQQLPKDWVPFQHLVMVEKMHVIFPPKKSWKKSEYPFMNTTEAMAAINAGKLILKTTRPDLPDNLKKLVNDSMSELVFKDDSIIAGEDNIRKYYGTGGMIIIELKGI